MKVENEKAEENIEFESEYVNVVEEGCEVKPGI